MLNLQSLVIYFYEGSNQYNAIRVLKPNKESEIFTGVLEELNHQYNYRPTEEKLWAEVLDGEVIFTITRLAKDRAVIYNQETGERYIFLGLEEYSFTRIARW
jgi:hypothetical protein